MLTLQWYNRSNSTGAQQIVATTHKRQPQLRHMFNGGACSRATLLDTSLKQTQKPTDRQVLRVNSPAKAAPKDG